VRGWTSAERLSVVPSDLVDQGEAARPTAGRFEAHGGDTFFRPRFPFVAGMRYSLLVDGKEAGAILRPADTRPAVARVVAIYPGAAELPLNHLRFYFAFSHPMSEGFAAGAIRVRRADTGETLEDVFLSTPPELWDPRRVRLTMLLDPGRIKRGLVPHEEAGYPLVEGIPIEVVVEEGFRDAEGRTLRESVVRRYQVGPTVSSRVDTDLWTIKPPAAGSREPLAVRFDRPLDRALLERCLRVCDLTGGYVGGTISIGDGECSWCFAPESPWSDGTYTLVVDSRLEDLAGNSIRRVFDRDLEEPEHDPRDVSRVTIAVSPMTGRE
jgi:hypothetical protein